jgi:hypothetical protein
MIAINVLTASPVEDSQPESAISAAISDVNIKSRQKRGLFGNYVEEENDEDCKNDRDCPSDSPFCLRGYCSECRRDSDCPDHVTNGITVTHHCDNGGGCLVNGNGCWVPDNSCDSNWSCGGCCLGLTHCLN